VSLAARWPDGVRCAVAMSVDLDAESVDIGRAPRANLWGRFSHGRYAVRVGVWRLLELFREHDIRVTFFIPAWDAERAPDVVEAIVEAGHEIGAHGYLHEDHSALGREERAVLERAHEVLTRVVGRPPCGWRAPRGLLSAATLGHLADLGYVYDASFRNDDLPHLLPCGAGRSLVEIPQFPFLNDTPFYERFRPPRAVRRMWLEEWEAVYDEGLLYGLKLHPRGDTGSGRALRAAVVGDVCAAIRAQTDVWVAPHAEIAAWFRAKMDGAASLRSNTGQGS
jgi:peptidoglycan/xylan/chitin deacetylase (PgdA/CDA1 family)